jgi:hypothetical protein
MNNRVGGRNLSDPYVAELPAHTWPDPPPSSDVEHHCHHPERATLRTQLNKMMGNTDQGLKIWSKIPRSAK